jgi:hypothetical protein
MNKSVRASSGARGRSGPQRCASGSDRRPSVSRVLPRAAAGLDTSGELLRRRRPGATARCGRGRARNSASTPPGKRRPGAPSHCRYHSSRRRGPAGDRQAGGPGRAPRAPVIPGTLVNALLAPSPGTRAPAARWYRASPGQGHLGSAGGRGHLRAHSNRWCTSCRKSPPRREYFAIARGGPTGGGTVDAPIGRHPRSARAWRWSREAGKRVTHYRLAERFGHYTALEVQLETGSDPPDPRASGAPRISRCSATRSTVGRLQLPAAAASERSRRCRPFGARPCTRAGSPSAPGHGGRKSASNRRCR